MEIDIAVPRARLAELLADPGNTPAWMDDLDRYEPLSGEPGMPGSSFRLVPKRGEPYTATVVARELPHRVALKLENEGVYIAINDRFAPLTDERTRLFSVEDFYFKGALRNVVGFLARGAIRKAHQRHMHAFKQFAESRRAAAAHQK